MTLNISAMSDAVMSEMATTVRGMAARVEPRDDRRHDAQSDRLAVEARLRDATAAVLTGTQQLFPGDVSIDAIDDPEIPGLRYLSVSCRSGGSVEEIMVAFDEWHQKLTAWAPRLEHLFRLSVDANE